ncbi:MAG: EamA family transporter [Chloroflexi bacterium]|nr:EamA family transporter [Chloroflexota bacterium]
MSASRIGASMAVASMLCVQFGLAVAVHLLDDLGAAGTTWLRLAWAAPILLLLVRPRPSDFSPSAFRATVALGIVTSGTALFFMASIARLPLGTASALEFLGPLGVAVARGRGAVKAWPVIAAVGVILLTQPWTGAADALGVAFALAAGVCWGTYIVLTQHVGDEVAGLKSIAVSIPVSALVATIVAGPSTVGRLTPELLLIGLGLAILLPIIPYTLEFLALRRLTTAAFGTLMSLEPAFALLIGFVALSQVPDVLAVLGIACVVVAGIGAERTGGREVPAPGSPTAPSTRPGSLTG